MKPKIKEIKRAIVEIENPMPEDNLISTYSDFLKVRDFLPYYKFNPIVFDSLLNVALECWDSKKRVSRISLVEIIKRYGFKDGHKINTLGIEVRTKLFELFRKSFEDHKYISNKQLDDVRQMCNSTLFNLELNEEAELWLCNNSDHSVIILNRVLRYPAKSKAISTWARENYTNDIFRSRRAELLGWVIDEEPHFEVDNQTLIDDFEFLNRSDLQAIRDYDEGIIINKIIEDEFGDYLPRKKPYHPDIEVRNLLPDEVDIEHPELKLSRRFYSVPKSSNYDYPVSLPDFESLRYKFYTNIELTKKITMIWAIGYSRIDNKTKANLLKQYYCDESYRSLLKVCKRIEDVGLLQWLLEIQ